MTTVEPDGGFTSANYASPTEEASGRFSFTSSSVCYSGKSSLFSHPVSRNSVSTTSTAYTQSSTASRDSYYCQIASNCGPPAPEAICSQSSIAPTNLVNHSTSSPRPQSFKDGFAEHRYWCTSCGQGFKTKFDWMRHEEGSHERWKKFPCPNCNKIYWLAKDFNKHHKDTHRCATCPHADAVRKDLKKRSAWGCGFCSRLYTKWKERCNHVSDHFAAGSKMEDWKHSNVIFGLLRQPIILREWDSFVENKLERLSEAHPSFGWN